VDGDFFSIQSVAGAPSSRCIAVPSPLHWQLHWQLYWRRCRCRGRRGLVGPPTRKASSSSGLVVAPRPTKKASSGVVGAAATMHEELLLETRSEWRVSPYDHKRLLVVHSTRLASAAITDRKKTERQRCCKKTTRTSRRRGRGRRGRRRGGQS
jgi:hypothetical protein